MVDKSHCKLPYDGTHPEVDDFYRFGGEDDGGDDGGEGGGEGGEEGGEAGGEAAEGDEESDEDDGEWEEVHDSDEVAAIERQAADLAVYEPQTAAMRRAEGRAAVAESEEAAVGDTVQELVLEDGRRLGHRSLARYYKQSVRPQELATHEMIDNLIASYRSMGHQIVS